MEDSTSSAEAQARRLGNVYKQVARLLGQAGVLQRLNDTGGEQEWSAMQILGHMTEMIPYWLAHCRTLIATSGEPPQFGRSLDATERLEGVERGASADPDKMAPLLESEIRAAMKAIRSISPPQREKKGVHIRRGEMTVTDIIEVFIVSHAEEHLEQLRTALGA